MQTEQQLQRKSRVESAPWHMLSWERASEALETSVESGLSDEAARERLIQYGTNVLPAKKTPSLTAVFFRQFANPLIYILIAAGLLSFLIQDLKDALFIFGVITFNAILGTIQEWKAEQSAKALQDLLKIMAHIKREGISRRVVSEEVVPGDLVFLESGERVPADIRLVSANNLSMDEAILTGESLPVQKHSNTLEDWDLPIGDRSNMAFAGTTVASGRGVGIVVATGLRTEVGRIAQSVAETATAETPLVLRMESFARKIGAIFLGVSLLLGGIAFMKGYPWDEVVLMAIALAVSAIPEGLPVAMTVALSIGSQRMARRNVIVRKLMAVEGLGSCTCIASDKTGTLTLNRQTAKRISLPNGQRFYVTGEGYQGDGSVERESGEMPSPEEKLHLERLATIGILCNEATLFLKQYSWQHEGDPLDVALLALGYKLGLNPPLLQQQMSLVGEIPYESARSYAARFYHEDGKILAAVKGAIEVILPRCQTQRIHNRLETIQYEAIRQESEELSGRGFRVIAIAEGTIPARPGLEPIEESELNALTFLGLIGLIDPLRPEAKGAIDACKRAGVRVVMVTGDHPSTALAISRELGIAGSETDVITGSSLSQSGHPESSRFLERVDSAAVFARVGPVQKLHIVQAYKTLGHFVAVTGDGVNDTPALRTANIGIAMGSGSDVAKDTAKIIITDDNFASIEAGIEEGRFAYSNVRKVIFLVLSTGAAEVALVMLALLANLPIPLVAVQLLWLNLVTNGIQDVALAFEFGEEDALKRPPRKPEEGIFDALMIQENLVAGLTMGLVAFGAWYWLLADGWDVPTARNMLLLLMVLLENFHTFNCRSERRSAFKIPLRNNLVLLIGVLSAQAIHILSMHIPFMQELLRIAPVSLKEWVLLLLLASLILVVMELFKLWKRRLAS